MSNKISNVKVFAAGTWNKQKFTEATLDGIVQAFTDANKAGRVPLKFGHGDTENEQPFREGMPALGWVSKIWRAGADLMADFTDIPTAVFESIRRGLYKFTSVEFLKNAEYQGKRFPYLLDAVALLGAEPPAVDDVSDLQKLALSRTSFKFAEVLSFTADRVPVISKFTPSSGDRHTMTEEEMRAAIAKAELAAANAQTKLAEKDAESIRFKSEAETLRAQGVEKDKAIAEQAKAVKADKVKMAREAATNVLEAAVRTKKILPAKRELFAKTLGLADDEKVLTVDIKDVEAMCDMTQDDAKKVLAGGKSAFSKDTGKEEGGAVDDESGEDHKLVTDLYTRSLERAKKSGKDIFSAMAEVVREDPTLGQRFLDYIFDAEAA